MGLICQCPAAAALETIEKVTCPENFGQIQKVAFQRLYSGTTRNEMEAIGTLATWDLAASGTGSEKVVISPYINAPADSGGDARRTSGGNDDLGGIPEVLGGNPVQFTGQFRGVPQKVIEVIKMLQCEAQAGNLGVYLFNANKQVECIDEPVTTQGATVHHYYPIPIRSLFVGSKIHGNFDAKDSNTIEWYYEDNYSDKLAIVNLDFNPLTDITV